MKAIYHYCSQCKTEWLHIPKDASVKNEGITQTDGFYFKCKCSSEIFLPLFRALELAGQANNQRLLDRIKGSF